jgi:hypothetical protein
MIAWWVWSVVWLVTQSIISEIGRVESEIEYLRSTHVSEREELEGDGEAGETPAAAVEDAVPLASEPETEPTASGGDSQGGGQKKSKAQKRRVSACAPQ